MLCVRVSYSYLPVHTMPHPTLLTECLIAYIAVLPDPVQGDIMASTYVCMGCVCPTSSHVLVLWIWGNRIGYQMNVGHFKYC